MKMVDYYVKQRIVDLYYNNSKSQKYVYGPISKQLKTEGICVGRKTVRDILLRFKESSSFVRKIGSGRPSKVLNPEILRRIEAYMKLNDEVTTAEIKNFLENFGIKISLTTVKRAKAFLGWTYKMPKYCQLIRDVNKVKRLKWAQENDKDNFDNVIWTDETSVWLERHKKRCYHKKGNRPNLKPRPKHPLKVHLWAGISRKGATNVCIFEGNMDAAFYIEIIDKTLKPFVETMYGREHRFMQDNDPKHTSKLAAAYMQQNNINWWHTPPESPDINPIEMVWHEMKDFIRGKWKPFNKQELINGIVQFWKRMSVAKCNKYIDHLKRVIPKVIEVEGRASGF